MGNGVSKKRQTKLQATASIAGKLAVARKHNDTTKVVFVAEKPSLSARDDSAEATTSAGDPKSQQTSAQTSPEEMVGNNNLLLPGAVPKVGLASARSLQSGSVSTISSEDVPPGKRHSTVSSDDGIVSTAAKAHAALDAAARAQEELKRFSSSSNTTVLNRSSSILSTGQSALGRFVSRRVSEPRNTTEQRRMTAPRNSQERKSEKDVIANAGKSALMGFLSRKNVGGPTTLPAEEVCGGANLQGSDISNFRPQGANRLTIQQGEPDLIAKGQSAMLRFAVRQTRQKGENVEFDSLSPKKGHHQDTARIGAGSSVCSSLEAQASEIPNDNHCDGGSLPDELRHTDPLILNAEGRLASRESNHLQCTVHPCNDNQGSEHDRHPLGTVSNVGIFSECEPTEGETRAGEPIEGGMAEPEPSVDIDSLLRPIELPAVFVGHQNSNPDNIRDSVPDPSVPQWQSDYKFFGKRHTSKHEAQRLKSNPTAQDVKTRASRLAFTKKEIKKLKAEIERGNKGGPDRGRLKLLEEMSELLQDFTDKDLRESKDTDVVVAMRHCLGKKFPTLGHAFEFFDFNGNKSVGPSEFSGAFKLLFPPIWPGINTCEFIFGRTAQGMYSCLDGNHDVRITFKEFTGCMRKGSKPIVDSKDLHGGEDHAIITATGNTTTKGAMDVATAGSEQGKVAPDVDSTAKSNSDTTKDLTSQRLTGGLGISTAEADLCIVGEVCGTPDCTVRRSLSGSPANIALGGNPFTFLKTWSALNEKKNNRWKMVTEEKLLKKKPAGKASVASVCEAFQSLKPHTEKTDAEKVSDPENAADKSADKAGDAGCGVDCAQSPDSGMSNERHDAGMSADDAMTNAIANTLLLESFKDYCKAVQSHGELVLERPYFRNFCRDLESLLEGWTDDCLYKVYDKQLCVQRDVSRAWKGHSITLGLTFEFFKLALFDMATNLGLAISDFVEY